MLFKLCNIDKTILACQSGHSNNRDNKDILELLLNANCPIDEKDEDGVTALILGIFSRFCII